MQNNEPQSNYSEIFIGEKGKKGVKLQNGQVVVPALYDGRTPLDLVRRQNKPRIDEPTSDELWYEDIRMQKCEQLLLKYGAKSIEDIREVEAQN